MAEAPREVLPESEITPPSEWCQHPERWTSTDDESTEVEVSELIGALVRAIQPDCVLETGTAFGQTTKAIAYALQRNGHGDLYTVDLNQDRQDFVAVQVRDLAPIVFANGHTEQWEPPPEVRFQFAFLDCDQYRRREVFMHFLPWFEPGTIVVFHDMAPSFNLGPHAFGAGLPSIEPLIEEGLVRLITLRTPRGLALAEVLRG